MDRSLFSAFVICVMVTAPGTSLSAEEVLLVDDIKGLPTRLAFGSCAKQDKPHPILREVMAARPDFFVYLGDNIYGDTNDMAVLQQKYDQLGSKPEFIELRAKVPVTAIWDDHDYGANDAGKEYVMKEESRRIFLDFWRVPEGSVRRQNKGIYGSHRFQGKDRIMQLILLDTRSFRDPLKKKSGPPWKNDYEPDADSKSSFLGEEQWKWLEDQLRQPADLRIIATSIQFAHEYNGWESWTNLPGQQKKMMELIQSTRANGVIFISGDVHWGEISRRNPEGGYPLFDVTSSGLTEVWDTVEPNQFRVGPFVRAANFGAITVDWEQADPLITLSVHALGGQETVEHSVRLSAISFPDPDAGESPVKR